MKKLLSRFSYRYPAVLIYMLQSTEYYFSDYFDWYHHTGDFSGVERTGHLKFTKKTVSLLAIVWAIYLAMIVGIIWLTAANYQKLGYWPIFLLLLLPFVLAYIVTLPVLFLKYLVQMPLELMIAAKLKARLAKNPATKIAIAGSYGKTTMREILVTVLGSGKKVAAPGGSLNTLWGISSFMDTLKGDEEILVFELGEYYPGDILRLARIVQPDMGIITGINEAHLKRFKTIEKTVATIFELVDFLGEKPVYINGDNELSKKNARGNFQLYSTTGTLGWRVLRASSDLSGTDIDVQADKKKLQLHSSLLGLHLVGSLLVAADIAEKLGLTEKEILSGIAATKPFSRRLQNVSTDESVVILDDSYNGNPDGVAAVIDFIAGIHGYRRIYVSSGLVEMGERNREVHLAIADKLKEAGIEQVILVENSATAIIAEGLRINGYPGKVSSYDSMATVRGILPSLVAKGDLVLLQTDWPDQYR